MINILLNNYYKQVNLIIISIFGLYRGLFDILSIGEV